MSDRIQRGQSRLLCARLKVLERPDFMASPIWERPRNLRFSFSISPNGFAKVILSIIPEHNREIGTCVTQYNALQ